jgi:transposase
MDIVIVGIDLGKNSCSLAGLDASGRIRRSSLGSFVTSLGSVRNFVCEAGLSVTP